MIYEFIRDSLMGNDMMQWWNDEKTYIGIANNIDDILKSDNQSPERPNFMMLPLPFAAAASLAARFLDGICDEGARWPPGRQKMAEAPLRGFERIPSCNARSRTLEPASGGFENKPLCNAPFCTFGR